MHLACLSERLGIYAGAGKSSLTCAMALGLAADPKVTTSASLTILWQTLIWRHNVTISTHEQKAHPNSPVPTGARPIKVTEGYCLLTQILGRADKAINFIKRGAEEAFTEVTLSAGPGKRPYIIQRTLKKDNMSRYRVNGE